MDGHACREQWVMLRLGEGDLAHGFAVTLQIGDEGRMPYIQDTGWLPAARHLEQSYRHWQSLYLNLGQMWRLEPLPNAIQQGNAQMDQQQQQIDCQNAAERLRTHFNDWLMAPTFRPLREKLLEQLSPQNRIRIILQTDDRFLPKLPWHQWDWLARYPLAELAMATPRYEGERSRTHHRDSIQILAILGSSQGIDVDADRVLLENLPQAQVQLLVKPNRQTLHDYLWEQPWDIFCFAGHSFSHPNAQTGYLCLNPQETLLIEDLKAPLRHAVHQGLQLAIFNSCDGLGIGSALAELHIPQLIVMREPIPDAVAQAFLKFFLQAFSQGQSLYLSVRQARERLHSLEAGFPCASWLPIICQNPAVLPPTWQQLAPMAVTVDPDEPMEDARPLVQQHRAGLQAVVASLCVAALMIGIRWLGLLQGLELWAFDQLLRSRPVEGPDSRMLVVTVTETDIQAQRDAGQGRSSLADGVLQQLLDRLTVAKPRVIGLDLYRDFPAEPQALGLVTQLRDHPALIGVCKSRDFQSDPLGVAPPPELPPERVGFSDFVPDQDGILRRQLLYLTPEPASQCRSAFALSALLAFVYLEQDGIEPTFRADNALQLGEVVIPPLQAQAGGYQQIDARGLQMLLNYRALAQPTEIAPQVTVTEVLAGRVSRDRIQDKIILIGGTANSSGDYWATPYGASGAQQIAGVFVQAQMTSQLISAVLNQRPLLWVGSPWQDMAWILGWAGVGCWVGWRWRLGWRWSVVSLLSLSIWVGVCWVVFIQLGGWLPLIPAAVASQLASFQGAYRRTMAKRLQPKEPQL